MSVQLLLPYDTARRIIGSNISVVWSFGVHCEISWLVIGRNRSVILCLIVMVSLLTEVIIDPRYVNSLTTSSLCPFMVMFCPSLYYHFSFSFNDLQSHLFSCFFYALKIFVYICVWYSYDSLNHLRNHTLSWLPKYECICIYL